MRVPGLVLVAAIGIFLGQGVAAAEKVKTNQSTKLYNRPGEQAKVLLTVDSGQSMTLLDEEGRWFKVRVKGRTGYVPRSKVDRADDKDITRNTRRRPFVDGRGKKRGFGGDAPDDRVGADATVDRGGDEEDEDEEEEDKAPPKKKVAAKATPAKGSDDDEDEEDEEDEAPAPKKKVAAKPTPKPAAKSSEDDEEDDEDDADEGDDEDTTPVAAKKSAGDDEDEDDDEADKRVQARVAKKVAVRDDPDEESEEAFVVVPTDILYPGETKGAWTFVENDAGDAGWIESDYLQIDAGEGGGGGGGGPRSIEIRARTGIMRITQGMRTAGSDATTAPDNYDIGTSAATIALGAGALFPRGKLIVGGEFTYEMARALGGGPAFDPDGDGAMEGVNIGITVHNVNVRGVAGLDFKKPSGMALFGRLGYRYQGFLIKDVINLDTNLPRIPSEVVKGPTIGAALQVPRLSNKLGVSFALDAMLFGAGVTQTKGLEDGASPSAKAIVAGTALTYHLTTSFDVQVGYDLKYMSIDFGAPLASSQRMHMGTNVKRTDIFHLVTLGIAKPF